MFIRKFNFILLIIAVALAACASVQPLFKQPFASVPLQPVILAPVDEMSDPVAPASLDETPLNRTQPLVVNPPSVPVPAFEFQPDPLIQTPPATRLPILEYHYSTFRMGVGVRMETKWFESQLQWLDDNGYTTVTSQQLTDFLHGSAELPQRSVALTFDVGASKFDDYANVVIPTLRQHGFHGIFFILASRTLDSCDDPTIACWPTIKQWADEGVISVGSHSWSHLDYKTLGPEQIYLDAAHSKALIEEKTGHTVQGICYPFDSVNPAAYDLLESLGYQFAVAGFTRADRSALFNDRNPYNLPRYYPYSGDYYPVIGGTHGQTFDEMMLGAIN